jgi:primase-polymerase (primpol)-like protein
MKKSYKSILPEEIINVKNFVVWDQKKFPHQSIYYQTFAKTNDPSTWSSLADAEYTVESGYACGIGFVFEQKDNLVGIDLDTIFDPKSKQWAPEAEEILDHLVGYKEFSQSGFGVHIIVKANLVLHANKAMLPTEFRVERIVEDKPKLPEIEMYNDSHYFALTGNILPSSSVKLPDQTAAVKKIYDKYILKGRNIIATQQKIDDLVHNSRPLNNIQKSDEELLGIARNAANGEKFKRLFDNGDIEEYKSQSEAEMALASLLAFYWQGNPYDVERMMKSSALCREKMFLSGYIERTINKAISGLTGYYGQNYNSENKQVNKTSTIKPKVSTQNHANQNQLSQVKTTTIKPKVLSKTETNHSQLPQTKVVRVSKVKNFTDDKELDQDKVFFDPDYIDITYCSKDGGPKKVCRKSQFMKLTNVKFISQEILSVDENMILLLEHYGIELHYNVFRDEPEIFKKGVRVGQLQDSFNYIRDLCKKQKFKIPAIDLEMKLLSIAKRIEYNPIADYLDDCLAKYDGKDYIAEICDTIKSTLPDDTKRKYIERFLLTMVTLGISRDDETNSQQAVLVLQGKQGLGKTKWFERLLPEKLRDGQNYFFGGRAMDLNNKDHILEQAKAWLVEMGELAATFRKSDQEVIKAYITNPYDRVRPPYYRVDFDKKRRMCLCATTNDDEFLRDATGDRRFTIIPCSSVNSKHHVNIDGMWGQVYKLHNDGAQYWYDLDEIEEIMENNAKYRVVSDLQSVLEELYDLHPGEDDIWKKFYKATKIIEIIQEKKLDKNIKLTPRNVVRTLKNLGCRMKVVHSWTCFELGERRQNFN